MALTAEQISGLRAVFDSFDGDGDGLLQADEVGYVLQCCGVMMSEPEVCYAPLPVSPAPAEPLCRCIWQVLDMITEVQPNLRQLPFDEFVSLMSRPMPSGAAVDLDIRESFGTFAGPDALITTASLEQALSDLGRPVSKLQVCLQLAYSAL